MTVFPLRWLLPSLCGLTALLVCIRPATAQQLVRYRNAAGGPFYSAAQLDSLLQARNARLAGNGFLMERQLTTQVMQHDTLVQLYKLRITNAGVRENEKRYLALVGQPLPEFALRDLAGRPVTAASLRGRPVVLNLWFTTCRPCLAEVPTLNQMPARYPDTAFLALTFEPKAKVQALLRQQPFTWRQLPDAAAYCARFTQDYPISVFVDKDGIIRRIIGGMPQRYDPATRQATSEVDATEFEQALQAIRQ